MKLPPRYCSHGYWPGVFDTFFVVVWKKYHAPAMPVGKSFGLEIPKNIKYKIWYETI